MYHLLVQHLSSQHWLGNSAFMLAYGCFTTESQNRIVDIDVSVSSYVVKRYQMNSQVRHYVADTVVPHYRYHSPRITMFLRDRIMPDFRKYTIECDDGDDDFMLTTAVMMVGATNAIE